MKTMGTEVKCHKSIFRSLGGQFDACLVRNVRYILDSLDLFQTNVVDVESGSSSNGTVDGSKSFEMGLI